MVDLAAQAPESGSYTGDRPDGLPLVHDAGRTGSPMMVSNVEPKRIELTAEVDGQTVASTELVRLYLAPGNKRVEVRDDGLRGVFFVPAGDGPFPAIILLSGSGGGLSEAQAALYAAHGYAALALAYFRVRPTCNRI